MDFIRHLIHCWGLATTIASFFLCLAIVLLFFGLPFMLIGLSMKYWPFMHEKYFEYEEKGRKMIMIGATIGAVAFTIFLIIGSLYGEGLIFSELKEGCKNIR